MLTVKLDQLEKEGKTLSEAERELFRKPILEDYENRSSYLYSTARLWDDGVLDPARTRESLGLALYSDLSVRGQKPSYAIFRM